jgi:hypothetical protein
MPVVRGHIGKLSVRDHGGGREDCDQAFEFKLDVFATGT